MPDIAFHTGFEHGTQLIAQDQAGSSALAVFIDTVGQTSVTGGAAKTGNYGLQTTQAASGAGPGRVALTNPGVAQVHCSFYWRVTTKPTSVIQYVWYADVASGNPMRLVYDPGTNRLKLSLDAGSSYTSNTNGINTNQWYLIEIALDYSGTTWAAYWRIDGIDQTNVTASSSATTFTRIGPRHDNVTGTDTNGSVFNYDDITVGNTFSDYPLGWLKTYGTTLSQSATPNHSSLTLTEWQTTSDFSSFTNFTSSTETVSRGLLNDLSGTNGGIRMNAGDGGQAGGGARWPIAAIAGAPSVDPSCVSTISTFTEASAGTNNITLRTRVTNSGTSVNVHYGGDFTPPAAWEYWRSSNPTAPGGSAWKNSDIGNLQFEATSSDSNPAIWLGGVFLEVGFPDLSTTWINYRIGKNLNAANVNFLVSLKQGSTVIATWQHINVAQGFTTYSKNLSSAQEALITDTTDLRLNFTSTVT